LEECDTAGQATHDNILRRMCFACSVAKATDTQAEHQILVAFARQQWLLECDSIIRLYIYIALFLFLVSSSAHGPPFPDTIKK
jgi:hypothetical protein